MAKYTRTVKEEFVDCYPQTQANATGYQLTDESVKTDQDTNSETEDVRENKNSSKFSLEKLREVFVTKSEFNLLKWLISFGITIVVALLFIIPLILNRDDRNEILEFKKKYFHLFESKNHMKKQSVYKKR